MQEEQTVTLRRAAQKIRDEMVCCDTYSRLEVFFDEAQYRALRRESNYHGICHYGEWAARILDRIAEQESRP